MASEKRTVTVQLDEDYMINIVTYDTDQEAAEPLIQAMVAGVKAAGGKAWRTVESVDRVEL